MALANKKAAGRVAWDNHLLESRTRALVSVAVLLIWVAAVSGCSGSAASGCRQDIDCGGVMVCRDGECVACAPDCGNRVCGPDPVCGASCGSCEQGEVCQDGACLPKSVSSYDVVVVGAGTGGCATAIEAARLGMRVALLEETDWIGGQAMAAGVSSMDESPAREREFGIYKDFIDRVRAHYAALGKSVGTCYWSSGANCFEPRVGQAILEQMLAEADTLPDGCLDVFRRKRVVKVLRSGSRVTGVVTRDNRQFDSTVLIDATEYGDILPLAGAAYRAGNSVSGAIDPGACIQDITYTAIIKKYPAGVPPDLVLSEKPPGFDDEAPFFALIVTSDGQDWPNWSLPPEQRYPLNFVAHNAYRGTPDAQNPEDYNAGTRESAAGITKTGVNYANDYPAHAAYNPPPDNSTLPVAYLEDTDYRRQVNCEAKLRTLQFLYYVQHDLDEPLWSVADDEGYDTAYNAEENDCPDIPAAFKPIERRFPVIPYVRESRRLIGLHTLTASEMARVGDPPLAANNFPDALAVCGYGNDLHNCNADSTLESALETRADISPGGPFQVPFGCFIPETIDGLLPAEKNLSQTRLVSGATRLQPSTMLTGQAAGALAAVAVQRGLQLRDVPPILVQDILVRAGVRISRFLYTDVPGDDPAWPAVQIASTHEILVGYGNGLFGRDDALTRGQMAVVLVRLFDLPVDPPQTPSFGDVPADHPFYGFIEAIKAAGITAGCQSDPPLFCPDDASLRVQVAQAAQRVLLYGL